MTDTDYCTLTELGAMYGVSRNEIGKWLKEAGVRDRRGNPQDEGMLMTIEALAPNGLATFYVWHRKQTIRLLDSMGYQRLEIYSPATPT